MVGFMGCAAAVNALKVAHHIVRSEPAARVLVVNLELCTLHLQETSNLEVILSALLFGDGCAASLVSAEPQGIALKDFRVATIPDTRDLITWRIGDAGFEMSLSGRGPAADREGAPARGDPQRRRRHPARAAQGGFRPLGRSRGRPDDPRCGRAGARTRSRRPALVARRPARFRQHVIRDPDVRARPHDAAGSAGLERFRHGLRTGARRRDLPLRHRPDSAAMARSFAERSHETELMDTETVSLDDYRACLKDLATVNALTLTHRPIVQWLDHATRDLKRRRARQRDRCRLRLWRPAAKDS